MEHILVLMVMRQHGYLHLVGMVACNGDAWHLKYAKFGIEYALREFKNWVGILSFEILR